MCSLATQTADNSDLITAGINTTDDDATALLTLEEEFDVNYGLLEPRHTILVRAYSEDSDDSMAYRDTPAVHHYVRSQPGVHTPSGG